MTKLNDTEKLRRLIPHWIEHNRSHAAEFLRWSSLARAEGQEQAAALIANAAALLRKAEDDLKAALDRAGGPAERHNTDGHRHHGHKE